MKRFVCIFAVLFSVMLAYCEPVFVGTECGWDYWYDDSFDITYQARHSDLPFEVLKGSVKNLLGIIPGGFLENEEFEKLEDSNESIDLDKIEVYINELGLDVDEFDDVDVFELIFFNGLKSLLKNGYNYIITGNTYYSDNLGFIILSDEHNVFLGAVDF